MGCRGVSGAGPMASVEELWLHWSRPLHSSRLADLARRSALSRGCPMALDAASALSPGYHAERPLLPRGAPAVCGEPPEELDAKYARRYPYGVICRGLLVPAEAPRLTLVAVVLLLLCSITSWAAGACSPPRGVEEGGGADPQRGGRRLGAVHPPPPNAEKYVM